MSRHIRQRVGPNIIWNFVSQATFQILQIVVMVVLARLLTPRDYGVVAIVLVLTNFAIIFVDLGLTPAVIQRQSTSQTDLSTVFWMNTGMGSSLFIFFWIAADHIATFYKEPLLTSVVRVVAATFLLSPLVSLPRALLQREMRFRA